MKEFFQATELDPENSDLSRMGKGMVIFGRLILALSGLAALIIILIMYFAPHAGVSGLTAVIGVFVWLLFEVIGTVVFHFGLPG